MNPDLIISVIFLAVPILSAIILHEVAHGWVASKLGDPTAARMGRLTLNPLSHIDIFGTILLPALLYISGTRLLFGYAKPVPVNFNNLRNPKRDMVWVALAGPVTNILLALVSVYVYEYADGARSFRSIMEPLAWMARASLQINVMLAVFNLFPLPPLDGGRVLVGLLPNPYSSTVARIEPFGFLIIIILLVTNYLNVSPIVDTITRILQNIVSF